MPNRTDLAGKRRILLLAESPYFGGITSHILSILDAFRDSNRFEFITATFPPKHDDTTLVNAARTRDVPVHVLPMSGGYDVRVLRALRAFVAERRIDLIHTHNYRATLLCALAAPGPAVINTFHGMMVDPSWRLRAWQWLEMAAMRRHRLTIACSEYLRQELLNRGLEPNRLRVVYNAFSCPESPDNTIHRESIAPNGSLIALFVGRLAAGKGVETAIDAVASRPGWTLVVAGDGPLRSELEKRASATNAAVRFVGMVTAVGAWYTVADVVVLASRMEAFPMVLIEAAAYGKPVIASRVGGVPELVRDGDTGILIDPNDAAALGSALDRLGDSAERVRMGNAARATWKDRFSPERMAEDLGRVYNEALDS